MPSDFGASGQGECVVAALSASSDAVSSCPRGSRCAASGRDRSVTANVDNPRRIV